MGRQSNLVKKQIILNRSQSKKTKVNENTDLQPTAKRVKLSDITNESNGTNIVEPAKKESCAYTHYYSSGNFNFSEFNIQNYNKSQISTSNYTFQNDQSYQNTQYSAQPIYNYSNYNFNSMFNYQSMGSYNYYNQYNYEHKLPINF